MLPLVLGLGLFSVIVWAMTREGGAPPPEIAPPPPPERRPPPARNVEPGVLDWVVTPPDPAEPDKGPLRMPVKRSTDAPFPMPTEMQLDAAERMVPQLERRLLGNLWSSAYVTRDRQLFEMVRDFQSLMGLSPDGRYGPRVAGAVMFLTGRPPPPPMFVEPRSIVAYEPIGSGVLA